MRNLLKRLYPYILPYWPKVLMSILFSFALAGIKGIQAFMVKPVFDNGLRPDAKFEDVLILAGILLLLGMINFPCRFFHFYWIRFVVDRATCSIREEIFGKLQRLSMSFYSLTKQGTLLSNILNDTQVFSQGFRNSVDLIREPLTAIIMFGLALYRDWALTLVIVAVLPLFLIIFQKSGRKVRANQGDVQEQMSELTHNISEGVGGQKIIKAFNLQRYAIERFRKVQNRFFNAQMRTTMVEEMAHPFVELVGAIAFSGVIVFAYYRISSGAVSPGDFISFVTALALLMDPIRKFSQANVKLNQSRAAGERIFSLLSKPEEKDDGNQELPVFEKDIEINNVTFSYGDKNVLNDFSIKIEKGQKVALVGLSGSGKSTLINLLLGLYHPQKGEIKIDGIPIQDLKLQSLRGLFGLVSQDLFLFNDTVHENLSLGKDVSNDEVNHAMEVAYATGFVNELPQQLETLIGDRGTRLSGGQCQRLTIARAFLRNPQILLFDEATSALDNESEKVVQKAFDTMASDKTVVAVAHRLSTIQEYDQIFVLKEGSLIEQGTHGELMDQSGEYAKLYELSRKS